MQAGRAALERALDRIGREIGQDLVLNGYGRAVIELNLLFDCDVVLDQDAGRIELATPLCMVAAGQAEDLYAAALRLTLSGIATAGAAIALHPEMPVLSLRLSLQADPVDDHTLEQQIRTFLVAADAVRDGLAQRSPGEASTISTQELHGLMIRG